MSDIPPKPVRTTGLSPKEQKLQALREKLNQTSGGGRPAASASGGGFKAKSNVAKKTAFQRKAT